MEAAREVAREEVCMCTQTLVSSALLAQERTRERRERRRARRCLQLRSRKRWRELRKRECMEAE
jgi:hypothetical protein